MIETNKKSKEVAEKALMSSCVRYVEAFECTGDLFFAACMYFSMRTLFGKASGGVESDFGIMAVSYGMLLDIIEHNVEMSPAYTVSQLIEKHLKGYREGTTAKLVSEICGKVTEEYLHGKKTLEEH